ncbi:nipblb [Symbiodinium pilosum]|uniref:Nipblb protein n=1 Tax=Symbiodinium pilosum TaxID=2952 RepID=A0A812WYM4_SYMPI|nr:nipblb [Symbiodinium pilosum]
MNVFSVYCTHAAHVFCVHKAELAVELDLTKVTSGLGLEVDWADGKTLFIKSVKAEGAVPHWNKKHAANPVAAGDRIISINGKAGDPKAMLAVCKKEKQLSLLIRTGAGDTSTAAKKVASSITSAVQHSLAALPSSDDGGKSKQSPKFFDFNVTVDMAFHSQLGLDVDTASGKSLYVRHLQAGAIEEWNRKHPAHLSVHAGDRIVAVNGFAHDAQAMVSLCRELMQSRSKFQLRVRGPPPPPSKIEKSKETLREDKVEEKKPSDPDGNANSSSSNSSSAEEKAKDAGKSKEKDREKTTKQKDKDKDRSKDQGRVKDKDASKDKERVKDKDRKSREREREKDGVGGKDKEKAKDKQNKEKKDKDKDRDADKDRGKKRARSPED